MKKRNRSALILILLVASGPLHSESRKLVADSTLQEVKLVELYTSQSCSSCPPAEARLSRLKSHADLWKKIVPVAWHVDYWNHLNWKDAFSSSDYSSRQRAVAQTWPRPQVYTPAFVVGGKEWQGWSKEPLSEAGKPAKVRLMVFQESPNHFSVQISGTEPKTNYVLHAARLGMDVASSIGGGENSGLDLKQDFVVLELITKKVTEAELSKSEIHWAAAAPYKGKSAIAVWIEDERKPIPLQATGGYL